MNQKKFIEECNRRALHGDAFIFILDYELTNFHIYDAETAAAEGVFYEIRGNGNVPGKGNGGADSRMPRSDLPEQMKSPSSPVSQFTFEITPVEYEQYQKAFDQVRKNILHGNSFLLNLTFPTKLDTDLTLEQIFRQSRAPYKLLFKDRFVVFSPETFVKISDDRIFTYPMKGTIDAAVEDAERKLMENEKEQWEHNTIVDLLRNDLSMVAKDVEVLKYRYIDRVRTHRKELLQVSSEIAGRLEPGWKGRLGEILVTMLPAGSICGAPKRKTLEIIAQAEGEKRGYFTGIFGIFQNGRVDSAVMIRYIERNGARLRYRSGGGITGHSDPESEYNEMIDKVYVPIV